MDDDSVGSFNFVRVERFHGLPEFFSVRNTFRIQIVKVLLLSVSYNFCTFIPLFFTVLQIYASASLLNLLRNFDLVMISFLGLFVIKGLFMYMIFFVYKDQNI